MHRREDQPITGSGRTSTSTAKSWSLIHRISSPALRPCRVLTTISFFAH